MATSAASQTTTAAAIHVPTPLIEKPSESRSVTSSDTSVAINAVAPIAPSPNRRSCTARNGVSTANTIVKMTTATMNDATLIEKPSRTIDATISPTALARRR